MKPEVQMKMKKTSDNRGQGGKGGEGEGENGERTGRMEERARGTERKRDKNEDGKPERMKYGECRRGRARDGRNEGRQERTKEGGEH